MYSQMLRIFDQFEMRLFQCWSSGISSVVALYDCIHAFIQYKNALFPYVSFLLIFKASSSYCPLLQLLIYDINSVFGVNTSLGVIPTGLCGTYSQIYIRSGGLSNFEFPRNPNSCLF